MDYIKNIKDTVKNKNLSFVEKLETLKNIQKNKDLESILFDSYIIFKYNEKLIIININKNNSTIENMSKTKFIKLYVDHHIKYQFNNNDIFIRCLKLILNIEKLTYNINYLKKLILKYNNYEFIEILFNNILSPHIFTLDLLTEYQTLYILKFDKKYLYLLVDNTTKMYKFINRIEFINFKNKIENYSNDMTNLFYALDDFYIENLKE